MPGLHAFLAHPKSSEDEEIARLKAAAELAIRSALDRLGRSDVPVVVVSGRDDFAARLAIEGGWDAWCVSVATGAGYRDGAMGPLFDAVVVAPDARVGRGTARIVEAALQVGKPVYLLLSQLVPVNSLARVNGRDFRRGWEVVTAPATPDG